MKGGQAMSDTNFLPYTLLAGAAFGCALLWVLVQWLRSDESVDSVEREVQATMQKISAADASMPKPEPTAEEIALEAYEARLASLLWWWGISGTVVGMVVGGLFSSFIGALLGGLVAPVLTTVGVMIAMHGKSKTTVPVVKPAPVPREPEPSHASARLEQPQRIR
jgi:F0F1-type ATP synthase assembly protein I